MVFHISKTIFPLSIWHLPLPSDICIMLPCALMSSAIGSVYFYFCHSGKKMLFLVQTICSCLTREQLPLCDYSGSKHQYRTHSGSQTCRCPANPDVILMENVVRETMWVYTWYLKLCFIFVESLTDRYMSYFRPISILLKNFWVKRKESCLLETFGVLGFMVMIIWVLVGLW